ncbi:MAG TPA: hypothetical protein VFM65_04015 [Flavobacteriaceae bacterium]|nr:hypothetical protein [Flavobacteriaceae bacterium]
MKKLLPLFILFLSFLFCQGQETKQLSGHYFSSEAPGIFEKLPIIHYLSGTTKILGTDLMLNKNTSYVYRNCSVIVQGKWEVKNDTLWLFPQANRWRNDSLNKYGYNGKPLQIMKKIMKFEIGNGILHRKFSVKFNERKMMAIETLVKDTLGR